MAVLLEEQKRQAVKRSHVTLIWANPARGPLPPLLSLSLSQHETLSISVFLPCAWASGF